EMMKDKLNNWKLIHKGMNPDAEAYLIWHRFGRDAVKRSDQEIHLQVDVEKLI
ncbi:unnamed protein product, partial [Rotaria socialis]